MTVVLMLNQIPNTADLAVKLPAMVYAAFAILAGARTGPASKGVEGVKG